MKSTSETPAQILKKHGFRKTEARVKVLHLLMHVRGPLSVEAIAERIPSVHLVTLYRMLSCFANAGILYQTDFRDGKALFEYQPIHHHHVTCSTCGRRASVSVCVEGEYKTALREATSFADIKSHVLEFFGICQKCKTSTS